MNEAYFNIDILGKLYIEDIFVYYGEPLLFSCKNSFGNLFLINCIETNDSYYSWIALPISEAKLLKAKKKLIDAREIFKHPEDDIMWLFDEHFESDVSVARMITTSDLNENIIPHEGTYLEFESDEVEIRDSNKIISLAEYEKRAIFDMSLEYNDNHGNEIPAEVLSKSVGELQKLVYSIAYKEGSITSRFPKHILEDNRLVVDSTYAASFGIRFKSDDLANVFGDVKFHNSISELMTLFSIKGDKDKLESILSKLGPKAGRSYEKLLALFHGSKTGFKAYYATPGKNYNEVFVSTHDVEANLKLLKLFNSNIVTKMTLHGTLVGIDVQRMNFVFIDDDGDKYEGKINDNINHDIYTVPCRSTIALDEIVEKNAATNREKISYIVTSIIEET